MATTYNWFFTDIVGASDPSIPIAEQAKKIRILNKLVEEAKIFEESKTKSSIVLSTGDGMVIGFKDNPEKPILLAIDLHRSILNYNKSVSDNQKIAIRIGIDSGPVYFVEDLEKRLSPWGPGIINARRVMDIGERMHILATDRIAHDVSMLTLDYEKTMHPIGYYDIKHGGKLFLYNIYGDDFGNKNKPPDTEKPTEKFHFTNIELRTDVTDPSTMMTHHTWLWELMNVTQEPISQVFYYLVGDTSKKFSELNVKVTDEMGNKLDIVSLNANEDKRMEFIIKTNSPIMPNQKGRSLKLEYDWEEPKRKFFYRVSSSCKEFKHIFTISTEIPVKLRVLKVDPEVGTKTYATQAPVITFHDDRTEMTWSQSNLKSFDAYEFQW